MSDQDPDHDRGFAPPGGGAPPPPPPHAEQPPAPGWWKASDGNWYPPQQDPTAPPVAGPPVAGPPPSAPTVTVGSADRWVPPPVGQGGTHPGTAPDGSLYYTPGGGAPPSGGLATWALVLGIVSIVTFWTCGLGVLFGILAVIFGVMARNRAREAADSPHEGRARAGLITGIIGIVGGVVFLVWAATALIPDVLDQVEEDLDDGVCEPDVEVFDPDC